MAFPKLRTRVINYEKGSKVVIQEEVPSPFDLDDDDPKPPAPAIIAAGVPSKPLFKFFNVSGDVLYVSKNSNFQSLVKKDWWNSVSRIMVEHYASLDDLAIAMEKAKVQGTKWNRPTA